SSSNEAGKAKTNLKQPVVEAFLSVHDLHKVILLEHFEPGKAEKLIKEFVEINNSKLFNWDFIEEIRQKLSDFDDFKKRSQGRKQMFAYNTETLSRLRSRKQKLNEILEEHNLNDKQIPRSEEHTSE